MSERIAVALRASALHALVSGAVALACAALVFGLWYPYPYSEFTGGRTLFLLIVAVDVVCGPLLTLVVFDRRKPKVELRRDLGVIVGLQLVALGYGLASVAQARPIYLAYEGDRFRVVTAAEIDHKTLSQAPIPLQSFGWTGPRLVGVRLLEPGDPEYMQSVQLAIQGLHPALRPGRWVSYGAQSHEAARRAHALTELRRRHPQHLDQIDRLISRVGLDENDAGFLPLASRHGGDWVVVVSRTDGRPRGFLPLDGW